MTASRRRRLSEGLSHIFLKTFALRKQSSQILKHKIDVIIYFADPPSNLYQIRDWYAPLQALSAHIRVAILACHSLTFLRLLDESPVPVIFQDSFSLYERLFAATSPSLILYVNHNVQNLASMQYGKALTVFISHGESDKPYMTWGQIRAYDYSLVAGRAAISRLISRLPHYSVSDRTIVIGRPQCDDLSVSSSDLTKPVITALYCPTRESDRMSMALSSVLPVGIKVVDYLLANRIRVIYRPHPCLGKDSTSYAKASKAIVKRIRENNQKLSNPDCHSIVDTDTSIYTQIEQSTFCVSDISALGIDYLASAKPLVVLLPDNLTNDHTIGAYLGAAYKISFKDIDLLPQTIDRLLGEDPLLSRRKMIASYYFDGLFSQSATNRFVQTVLDLVHKQQEAISKLNNSISVAPPMIPAPTPNNK